MVIYEGIFFDEYTANLINNLDIKKLDTTNDLVHCTFKYHPTTDQIFDEIVGKSFDLLIVGYGNDGKNSGVEVKLPEELIKYYINYHEENPKKLKIPHITTSLSYSATPMNTKNLKFTPLETPIKVTEKFGYWIKKEDKEYLSFEKFL